MPDSAARKPPSSFEFWRPLVNDFNPVGPVDPAELREFFVDRKEQQPAHSVLQRLRANLRFSAGQSKLYKGLLTGHVGSGKTSELMRLAQELALEYFVVWLDAEISLAKEKANHLDVLLAMGIAVYSAAQSVGLKPKKDLANAYVQSFAKFVRKYEGRKNFTLKLDQVVQQIFTIALTAAAGAFGGPAAAVMAGAAAAGVSEAFKATSLELNVKDELVHTLELPGESAGDSRKVK